MNVLGYISHQWTVFSSFFLVYADLILSCATVYKIISNICVAVSDSSSINWTNRFPVFVSVIIWLKFLPSEQEYVEFNPF